MGNIPKCMFCGASETEESPILQIHSRCKRHGQCICLKCLKHKIEVIRLYNEKLMRIPSEDNLRWDPT